MRSLLLGTVLAGLGLPALAEVDASNPARLLDMLRTEGYSVELGADSVGDPKISGKIDGTNFEIFFYDCTNNVDCRTIQFQVGYDMTNGMDMAKANEWNKDRRYAAVYLDDEMDPYLQMDLNMDYGISDKNFVDNFAMWSRLMGEFEDFIDW